MIAEALIFLKDQLQAYLNTESADATESLTEKVVFPNFNNTDAIALANTAVSVLLTNIEEDRTLREADPYARAASDGTRLRVKPDVHMNLYVLFVARYSTYEDALTQLSRVIQYFQARPVFDHQNAPELSDRIERLIVELITLPLSEQNDLWSALRTSYQPSVMYRVKMVVFRDEGTLAAPGIKEREFRLAPTAVRA